MRTTLATVLIVLVSLIAWAHQDHMHGPHRHLQYATIKNPIPVNRQSITEGRALYEQYCIDCHGKDGKGRTGPALTPPTLIHGNSDGEIFHVISDGVAGTPMKAFKKAFSEKMRWYLVNYIKSLRRAGK